MLLMMTFLACKDQATLDENERLKVRVGDLERVNAHLESDNEALKATIARLEASQSASADAARLAPGGKLTATYGQSPNMVAGFNKGGGWAHGSMWRVADVTVQVDATGNTTGCTVDAIHPPNMTAGYNVTLDDTTY